MIGMYYRGVDLALATFLILRLSRFLTTDFLGAWWVTHPATAWAIKHDGSLLTYESGALALDDEQGWRSKLVSGLECPFCVGFWIGAIVLASLWMVGGPGHAAEWWRWMAGVFTMNYIVGHIASRLD